MTEQEQPSLTKDILNVFFEIDDKGRKTIKWNFGEKINCFFLIGILEDIKQELINQINDKSYEELEG